MGKDSRIAWTDNTFNPWMGCQRISPACEHCYAETLVVGRMGYNLDATDAKKKLRVWGPPSTSTRKRTSAATWKNPLAWDRAAKRDGVRQRVFCASLADVFEAHPDLDAMRVDLWPLIEACDGLDWQLLTKRPENVRAMVPPAWLTSWPEHVWIGCTVESQEYAKKRIPHLLAVPARVRFLSCEPLLGALDLSRWLSPPHDDGPCPVSDPDCDLEEDDAHVACERPPSLVEWVIVGGESGPGARPFFLAWARSIVAQCHRADTPVFVKQLGAVPLCEKKDESRLNVTWQGGWSLKLHDRAGADPAEWPEDLRVQEFPR